MSDRMSNVEIEDVLSSIRRLVSEDLRPGAPRAPGDARPRLVLTPALRVSDEAAPAEAAVPAEEPGETTLEARIAELEAALAVSARDNGIEFERDEGDPMEAPSGALWPRAEEVEAESSEGEAVAEAPADVSADAPAAEPAEELAAPASDPALADEPLFAFSEAFAELHMPATPETAPDAGLDIGPDPWEEVPAEEELRPEPAAALEAGDDEDLIDEEILREMVRAILREELQGPLGERITRNVRKLVRAEIHRALSTMDLD